MISVLDSSGDVVVLNREFVPEKISSEPLPDLAIPESLLKGGEIFLTGKDGALMLAHAYGAIEIGPDCIVCIPALKDGVEPVVKPLAEIDLDFDPTEAFAPTAAGGNGGGSNAFVEMARVGDELLAEAGYDTEVAFGDIQSVAVVDTGGQLTAIDEPLVPAQSPVDDGTPIAVADSIEATEDSVFNGDVSGNDSLSGDGGNAFSITDADQPAHGSVVMNADGTFSYTPDANYNGADSFSYTLTDADGDSSSAVVSITVGAVDDAPTFSDVNYTFGYDENSSADQVLGAVTATDLDGDTVSYSLSGGSDYFEIDTDGNITLTEAGVASLANDFESPANSHQVTVTASDGNGDSAEVVVTLNEQNVNEVPDAVLDTAVTSLNDLGQPVTSGNILANDSSPDGGLTLTSISYHGVTKSFTDAQGNQLSSVEFDSADGLGGTLNVSSNGDYTFSSESKVIDQTNYSNNGFGVTTHAYIKGNGSWSIETGLFEVGQLIADTAKVVAVNNGSDDKLGIGVNGNPKTVDLDEVLLFDLESSYGNLSISLAHDNTGQNGDVKWTLFDSAGVHLKTGDFTQLAQSDNGGTAGEYLIQGDEGTSFQYLALSYTGGSEQGFLVDHLSLDSATGPRIEDFVYQIADQDGDTDLSHLVIGIDEGLILATSDDDSLTGTDDQADLFVWEQGQSGSDTVINFDAAEDTLYLGDLLQEETADTLDQYLDFRQDGDSVVIDVRSELDGEGQGDVTQQITLQGTSLDGLSGGASTPSDATVITKLLEDNALLTD